MLDYCIKIYHIRWDLTALEVFFLIRTDLHMHITEPRTESLVLYQSVTISGLKSCCEAVRLRMYLPLEYTVLLLIIISCIQNRNTFLQSLSKDE